MQPPEGRKPAQERWLRFYNTIGYNALAPLYASLDWLTLGAWWRLVRRALDFVPKGGRVLEVGFGPGKLHVALTQQADLLVGLDLARGMCRLTADRMRRADRVPRIVQGDALALPLPPASFDVVVSTFALSGIPDAAQAVQEFGRVIGPGGRIVLVDIGLPTDGNRIGVFWARLWERMGDTLYDHAALFAQAGLPLTHLEEFGPGHHIRAIVAEKPQS
ncbi:MAG: hypothetical protein Kow0077_01920 [Anaerolineae bacterium]